MRGLIAVVAGAALFASACAHQPDLQPTGPSVEVALDEGPADQRPLTPPQTFEMLMRIDPRLPAFRPRAMRFLLAQPGHLTFTVYASTPEGNPGPALLTIDRVLGPELTSDGKDGKWLVEDLSRIPVQRAPIFIGISSPEKSSDPRLWASSNDSGNVFQREADPSVPLSSTKIPRTPKLRVTVDPAT